MKKINVFSIIAITLITTIGIISCSEDNAIINSKKSEFPTYKKGSIFIDSLANVYEMEILESSLHRTYKSKILEMIYMLNAAGERAPLDNRADFEDYIDLNLGDTYFTSTTQAMSNYDSLVTTAEEFYRTYTSFFNELKFLDKGDVIKVLRPGFGTPPAVVPLGACQNDCMDSVSGAIDDLDVRHAAAKAHPDCIWLTWFLLDYSYWNPI